MHGINSYVLTFNDKSTSFNMPIFTIFYVRVEMLYKSFRYSGLIHGLPSNGQPQLISFQKNFTQGALLSVVSVCISYVIVTKIIIYFIYAPQKK